MGFCTKHSGVSLGEHAHQTMKCDRMWKTAIERTEFVIIYHTPPLGTGRAYVGVVQLWQEMLA